MVLIATSLQLMAESEKLNSVLLGNPNMNFFKVVYRRSTNFSIEHVKNTQINEIRSNTTESTMKIDRNGDLISKMWLDAYFYSVTSTNSPTFLSWCNNTGHAYLKSCELIIGGKVDKHDSIFLDVYNELTDTDGKQHMGLNKQSNDLYMKSGTSNIAPELQLYIPLQFYFNRNYGVALPLVALDCHNVELKFEFREIAELLVSDKTLNTSDTISTPEVNLWVEFIILDDDEKRRFVSSPLEYLIEQVQSEQHTTTSTIFDMNFSNPVKQIIWVFSYNNRTAPINIKTLPADPTIFLPKTIDDAGNMSTGTETLNGNDYFNYHVGATGTHNILPRNSGSCMNLSKTIEHFDKCTIRFQSDDRFESQKATFFRYLQPSYYCNRIPTKSVYTYSFALNPNEYGPSGTCNFSRISDIRLSFNDLGPIDENRNLYIYAINYNILRIENGSALVKYAN